ncbi:disease resistance protein SUMM2 isoform X2 [Jatropha curcas]|uniref:disease resistance protein SUMM2 isoform X2 n=1 Tax=Jatropha curcas TaxID=180498 RepID=UPI0009D7440C|nr:disease resistance protein SUMM2 isoform X2 [Jatropha curcas]
MSIPRRPKEAVLGLQKRMHQAKDLIIGPINESKKKDPLFLSFENIDRQLRILKFQFSDVKFWQDRVSAKFNELEHQIYKILSNAKNLSDHGDPLSGDQKSNVDNELDVIAEKIEVLRKALQQLAVGETSRERSSLKEDTGDGEDIVKASVAGRKTSKEWLQLTVEEDILTSETMKSLKVTYDNLDRLDLKLCALCFSIFPENATIKKRPLINWWISEGFVASEEVGEDVFKKLIEFGLIIPYPNDLNKPMTLVNECTVDPWIKYMLISLAKPAGLFDFDSRGIPSDLISKSKRACLVSGNQNFSDHNSGHEDKLLGLFNVSEKYIDFKPDLLPKLKKVEILQLGGWQASPKSRIEGVKHHIEVVNEEFLMGLGLQNHLKYISLRGISRITSLPSSISDLFNLEILDLKACHNLETLPFDISKLRKLTHLDVSDCPLLERMPQGLDKLTNLQVLKGFMIGDLGKTPCRVAHLTKMVKLRRLSVYIGAEAVVDKGEFSKLENITNLRCLTISWGVRDPKRVAQMTDLSFPANLEKLDLRGIPCLVDVDPRRPLVQLNSSKLKNLKRLYIRGGELRSLNCEMDFLWTVEILQLKYLKYFEIETIKLADFPHLIYLEVKCDGEVESNENGRNFVWTGKKLEEEKVQHKKKGESKKDDKHEEDSGLTENDKYLDKARGKSKVEDNYEEDMLPKFDIEEEKDEGKEGPGNNINPMIKQARSEV